jgi:hypothetical protein
MYSLEQSVGPGVSIRRSLLSYPSRPLHEASSVLDDHGSVKTHTVVPRLGGLRNSGTSGPKLRA